MITPEQVSKILEEFERRWRSRTPAKTPADALPLYKVPWTETLAIVEQVTGRPRSVQDRIDLAPSLTPVLKRLRREFPDLQW